jgi:mRNA interferase RelE/StbE
MDCKKYSVRWSQEAVEALEEVDNSIKCEIIKFLEKDSILTNPKSSGKSLRSQFCGLHRYRVGRYRIIVHIQKNILVILVLDIGHRSNIYE